MIAGVEGILDSRGADFAIVRVGGISLQIFVPSSSLDELGDTGRRVHLHTLLQMKEDNVTLYGFVSEQDREFFKLLTSVTGVGPRVAMAMLSHLSTEELATNIVSGDTDSLTRVPGVGKKTAARVALELKAKLEKDWASLVTSAAAADNGEIIAALTGLGYSAAEAVRVVSVLPSSPELNLEDKIKLALRHLAR
jgi:holliday junction DNA helicase RuvA